MFQVALDKFKSYTIYKYRFSLFTCLILIIIFLPLYLANHGKEIYPSLLFPTWSAKTVIQDDRAKISFRNYQAGNKEIDCRELLKPLPANFAIGMNRNKFNLDNIESKMWLKKRLSDLILSDSIFTIEIKQGYYNLSTQSLEDVNVIDKNDFYIN